MALLCKVRNSRYNYCAYILTYLIKHRQKSMPVEVDALDAFTTQLVQEKANKWDNMKLNNKFTTNLALQNTEKTHEVLNNVTKQSMSDKLRESIDENNQDNIMIVLETYKKHKTLPLNIMLHVLSYFAQTGHIEGIKYIQKMYGDINPAVLQTQTNFQHYLAEAIWVKGNIPKALTIFNEVYRNTSLLRQKIRLVLRYLFYDAAQKNSEAIMVAIVKFTEDLANEFKDYIPMVNLWKICLLSEWYSDQVLAIELLDRQQELLKALLPEVTSIVAMALKYHKTESAYKLLEILLKYNCKMECSMVLIALFDYKFRRRDFYSCSQILQWSTKYNVLLPAIQQEKVVQLLVNVKTSRGIKLSKRIEKKNYNLKF